MQDVRYSRINPTYSNWNDELTTNFATISQSVKRLITDDGQDLPLQLQQMVTENIQLREADGYWD